MHSGKDFVCTFTYTKIPCDHVSLVSLGNWSKNIQNKHELFCFFNAETFPTLGP